MGCNQQSPECKKFYKQSSFYNNKVQGKKNTTVWTYTLKETYQPTATFGVYMDSDFFFKWWMRKFEHQLDILY